MKTILKSVISLIMIFAAINSGFTSSNNKISNSKMSANSLITYQVNVNLSADITFCNTYLVVIKDGNGVFVAPAQLYVAGISTYTFLERGPVIGKRVAALMPSPNHDTFSCSHDLYTAPVEASGHFMNGTIYIFNLYPQTQPLPH